MKHKLIWHEDVIKDFKSIDISEAKKIINKAEEYLRQDPINLGKPLKGKYRGLYRYRIGDYRIIYSVNEEDNIITIYTVGHRKKVYKD